METDASGAGSKPAAGGYRSRVSVNFSWLAAGEVAGKGLAFVTTIYLARVLGKADYGLLTFATAIMTYGMLMADFGLSTYGTREIANRRADPGQCIYNVQITRLTLSVFLFILGSALTLLFVQDRRLQFLLVFSLASLVPFALGVDWVFRGFEKMGYSALGNAVQQGVYLLPVILFVSGPDQLISVPVYRGAGLLAASVVLMLTLKKRTGHTGFSLSLPMPGARVMWNMVRAGIPLAATCLMVQVYWNIDSVILGLIDTPASVGVYGAGYRVVTLANCFCYTITAAFYPSLSHAYTRDHAVYRIKLVRMVSVVLALGLLGTAGTYLLRHAIVWRLYGPGYEGAAVALSVLCLAILGDHLVAALGAAFISAGRDRTALVAVTCGAVSAVLLNIVLIPRYSFMGAAVSTVASYALMIIVYAANLRHILAAAQEMQ